MSTSQILFDTASNYTSESSDIHISESFLQFTGSISESGGGGGDDTINYMWTSSGDGATPWEDFAEIHGFNFTQSDWTIEFWISSSIIWSIPNDSLMSWGPNSDRELELRVDSPNQIFAKIKSISMGPGGTILPNSWQHVALCMSSSGFASIFVSGSRQVGPINVGAAALSAPTESFKLGQHNAPSVEFVNGLWEELRISKIMRYNVNNATYTIPTSSFNNDNDLDTDTLWYINFDDTGSSLSTSPISGTFFNSASLGDGSQLPEMTWTSSGVTDPFVTSESFQEPPLTGLTSSGGGGGEPVTQSIVFFTGTLGAYKTLGDGNSVPSGGLFYDGFSAVSASNSGSWSFLLSNCITSSDAVNDPGSWNFFNTNSLAWETSSDLDLFFNTVGEVADNIRLFQGSDTLWVLAVGNNTDTGSTPQLDSITVTFESASAATVGGGANIPLQHYVQTQIAGGSNIIP